MENFIFGGLSAAIAICVVNPIDVVKSRLQMQGEGVANAGMNIYKGPFSALKSIAQKEGIRGLYKGSTANYLRMCPQYILTFVFFEQMVKFNNERKEKG